MLLSTSFISFSSFAMHNARTLAPWVQAARTINVRTPAKQLNGALAINDNSTVLDVKNRIEDMEGYSG